MDKILSENLIALLLEQWVEESYNANFYQFISGFLKVKGLDKLADKFEKQRSEELGHAKLIFDFLTDMNIAFVSGEIDEINFPINTPTEIAEKYSEREISTTEHLSEELKQAEMDSNYLAVEFLRPMVEKQISEMKEVYEFQDAIALCSDDWWKIKVWNDSL